MNLENFKKYLEIRMDHFQVLFEYYSNEWFRKWQWRIKRLTQSSEDNLANQISRKFGKDCVLAYGCWNRRKQMPRLHPSPTVGIKEKLRKKFAMVNVPEWNTTKTCYLCDGETAPSGIKIKIKRKIKKGKFFQNFY